MLKQAIVLAGGIDPRLTPLSTSDHPKCLLPVANSPVLLYSLMALKHAGIMSVLVVRPGDVQTGRSSRPMDDRALARAMLSNTASILGAAGVGCLG